MLKRVFVWWILYAGLMGFAAGGSFVSALLVYRSIYNEQMPAVRRKLDWFGRTLITPQQSPRSDQ
jgi:hypothetical protein